MSPELVLCPNAIPPNPSRRVVNILVDHLNLIVFASRNCSCRVFRVAFVFVRARLADAGTFLGGGSQLWVISKDKRLSKKGAQQFSSKRGAVVKPRMEKELKLPR
jgi:hypothetical protein